MLGVNSVLNAELKIYRKLLNAMFAEMSYLSDLQDWKRR